MSENIRATTPPVRGGIYYELFCYLISSAFAILAAALYVNSNPVFVWAIIGYVAAIWFGWNADRSSWHPLRDLQTTQ